MFGLSLPLLLGLGLAGILALGGMGAFVYKQGDDHGFHKRDPEVAKLERDLGTAKDDYAAEKGARESRDRVIESNSVANQQLADASKAAQKAAAAAVAASQGRARATESLVAALTSQARSAGSESAAACPKTAGILGDASDAARAFDAGSGPAKPPAAPAPTAAPTITAPAGKVLPPAIRVRKP